MNVDQALADESAFVKLFQLAATYSGFNGVVILPWHHPAARGTDWLLLDTIPDVISETFGYHHLDAIWRFSNGSSVRKFALQQDDDVFRLAAAEFQGIVFFGWNDIAKVEIPRRYMLSRLRRIPGKRIPFLFHPPSELVPDN